MSAPFSEAWSRLLENTSCTSYASFLLSVSPQVAALLSAIALWVASRARSTSKDAQRTSQAALRTSTPPASTASVVLHPDVLAALQKHSSTTQAADYTSTSRGDVVDNQGSK